MKNQLKFATPKFCRAFSLLELLVVMAVVGLVAALIVPSLGTRSAYQITGAANQLKAALDQARQKAVAKGDTVDVRFYQAAGKQDFSAFRIVVNPDGDAQPQRIQRLPDGVVMRRGLPGSTLLEVAESVVENQPPPGLEGSDVRRIRFLSNGSLERLAAQTNAVWVSIAREQDPAAANGLPANFGSVSVDTLLGTSFVFRP